MVQPGPSNDDQVFNSTHHELGPLNGGKKQKSVRIDEPERRGSSSKPLSSSMISSSAFSVSLSTDDLVEENFECQRIHDGIPGLPKPKRRIQRRLSQVNLPRLVDRDLPYDQSSSRVQVLNDNMKPLFRLLVRDWFHVVLRIPWYYSFTTIIGVWYLAIWIFAWLFVYVDGSNHNRNMDCGLGEPGNPISLSAAYAFSLETCTTVGYGLPGSANGFFKSDCRGLQAAITVQMIFSMCANAFLVSFLFSLMSKSESRSIQIVFSKKLCVNVIDGKVCVNIRCYDLDSAYPLVECHARMHLIDYRMKFHPLRLIKPMDDLGGMLDPSAPTTIIHHVDHHSPLAPFKMPLVEAAHGLNLRSADSATGNREEIICPVCGESYGSYERLIKHIEYSRIGEKKDGYPVEGTHLGFRMPEITPITLEAVQRNMERKLSEIVIVVEAIDPQLSGTFRAIQSYKYEEIEFGAEFERCMSTRNNKFVVDMMKFHGVVYDDEMYNRSTMEFNFSRSKISF
mmetsp:Transcript_10672/g.25687  ORF Transcript_10672/g.25687 Transcript_10672/m.25687 type:complete len:509 (-) Transcript_10672:93-1619(-)